MSYPKLGKPTRDGPKFLNGRAGGATQASSRSGRKQTKGRLGKINRRKR